jgi:DNA-directed RNA polymerase beta subunit
MTYDKVHSRTTGPRTIMTRQPVEGRARKGGLRLGEMEKDCFVSHGASRVLLERMLYASDAYRAPMCTTCGLVAVNKHNSDFGMNIRGQKAYCRVCDGNVEDITMPFVYKLLLSELNAVGITVHHEFNEMIPADGPLPDGAVGAAAASVKSI